MKQEGQKLGSEDRIDTRDCVDSTSCSALSPASLCHPLLQKLLNTRKLPEHIQMEKLRLNREGERSRSRPCIPFSSMARSVPLPPPNMHKGC